MQVTYDRAGRVTALRPAGLTRRRPGHRGVLRVPAAQNLCRYGSSCRDRGPRDELRSPSHRTGRRPDHSHPPQEIVHEAHPGFCSRHRLRLRSPRRDDRHVPGRPDHPRRPQRRDHRRRPRQRPGPRRRSAPARAWSSGTPSVDANGAQPRPLRPDLPRPRRRRRRPRRPPDARAARSAPSPAARCRRSSSPPRASVTAAGPPPRRPPPSSTSPKRQATPELVVLADDRARRPWPGASTSPAATPTARPPASTSSSTPGRAGVLDQLAVRARGGRHRHRRCPSAPCR